MRTSLRKEILSDRTKILAEIQKEMLNLLAPIVKKSANPQYFEDSDSETENVLPTTTSTPIKI